MGHEKCRGRAYAINVRCYIVRAEQKGMDFVSKIENHFAKCLFFFFFFFFFPTRKIREDETNPWNNSFPKDEFEFRETEREREDLDNLIRTIDYF